MTLSYLRYALSDGYIDNWLVAGPQRIPVALPYAGDERALKLAVVKQQAMQGCEVTGRPVERGPLSEGTFKIGDFEGEWSYMHCLEDHFVDLSDVYPTCHYVRAWAYAELALPAAQELTFALTAYGQASAWINGTLVYHQRYESDTRQTGTFTATLKEGQNAILVQFEQVAIRTCHHAVALQLSGMAPNRLGHLQVMLPTTIEPVERRNLFERIFEAAYIEQSVYAHNDKILVKWTETNLQWDEMPVTLLLRTPSGRIYAQTNLEKQPDESATLGQPFMYPEGLYNAVLMPSIEEYHLQNMRISRTVPLWTLDNNRYSDTLYGDLGQRRIEALKHAVHYEDDIYAEMAKMAMQWWSNVEIPVITRAIQRINARYEGSVVDLLGLLGIVLQFGDQPELPTTLKEPLEQAMLGYRYWLDEAGSDVMDYATESRQLLFHTCEILAGQTLPGHIFPPSGQTGHWHRENGHKLVVHWLQTHAMKGFATWDSDVAFEEIITALATLIALAEDDGVWALAAAMMDKMLFSLAAHSYNGVFGGTQGSTETAHILHTILSATSGISRLMWGQGAFNHHTAGIVSLACNDTYEFPHLIQDIATSLPAEMWSHEHHAPDPTKPAVDKVTYRTPDYMLSSVQDYLPGTPGDQEHIWQATLGPGAVVFVNHPVCVSTHDARRPNYWRGNGRLPRVAQWKDALIAIYALPEDDWLGYTHAYFPVHTFDAYVLRDGWAFAQKGEGYLALTAAQGIVWTKISPHARHELRSYGRRNIWICHMGRTSQDGTFAEFQATILALNVAFDDLVVQLRTLRGETLAFGWQGPLLHNGETISVHNFKHHQSLYGAADFPAEAILITYGEQGMRLRFT